MRNLPASFCTGFPLFLLLFATGAKAQHEHSAPQAAPPPPPSAGTVRTGVQFHAEVLGDLSGLGVSASVGVGFNRVAICLTPGLLVDSTGSLISLGLSGRIYFRPRQEGALVGFIRPEAMVGAAGRGGMSFSSFFGGIGVGAGAEYLLTRNLGFTAELGIRYLSSGRGLSSTFSLGIMLHQ